MAKEKLFKPEDFEKPDPRSNGKWIKITLIIVACVAIICSLTWTVRSCSSEKEQEVPTEDPAITVKQGESQMQQSASVDNAKIEDDEIGKSETTEDLVLSSVEDNQETSNISKDVKLNTAITDDIETEALKVIRGDYGNVPKRKQLLGDKFQPIQNRVNQLKKEGVF